MTENSGLTSEWRNTLSAFEFALRLLHPAMPFLTEELWQRLSNKPEGSPASIALAEFPKHSESRHDAQAETEIGMIQDIVTLARSGRTQSKRDPKEQLPGTLYCRTASLAIAQRHAEAIQKIGRVTLEFKAEEPPRGANVFSTAEFDLVLDIPKAAEDPARKQKEREQLEKNIANSKRQLTDETFLSKAPAKVVDSIRAKLADYEAQLAKMP
ncbi:MAG: class I tRNA ligase family protein [Candidatus Solibacter sp.]|nr:class I tRNA ligase family protein [Candidatus Solibacter sp.]